MSEVTVVTVNQEEFTVLETEFASQYQTAYQTQAAAMRAQLKASVAAHRLGVLANRFQPMVEAAEGKGTWGAYLQRHDMAPRTVQRAQRIARCLDEETCSKMTLTQADDAAAAQEAVNRGNSATAEAWRALMQKLAEAREALDKQESEREKNLADLDRELEKAAKQKLEERLLELEAAKKDATRHVEADARAWADENAEALAADEMAGALKAEEEGKASIPSPRTEAATMPSQVVAALETPEAESDASVDEDEDDDLLDDEEIEWLAERLREIVSERAAVLTDASEDPNVKAALDSLLQACCGDAEVVYGVVSVWLAKDNSR